MAKPYYEFFSPVKVIAGHKALEHIPFELKTLGCSRPMIVTDRGVRGAGLIDHVSTVFDSTSVDVAIIFDDVPPDSSLETVRKAAAVYRDNNCDAIIAVGGGSVIDTSKGTNILVSEGGDDLKAYSGAHILKRPLKPFYVIPTTSGTGSETTLVAVVSDLEKNVKLPFMSQFLMPDAAILDPRMTLTLPPHITAMTAMDALTHAVEAYTCLAANPLSDAYACSSVGKISENLMKVMENPKDADARLELAQASTMAGIAFSNSMVGLVHSLGHALGAVCHLPHGLCMSLFLLYVLEYNKSVNGNKTGELLLPLAGAEVYATTPGEQRAEKAISFIKDLRDKLYDCCQLPRTLKETGKVSVEQIEQVARLAIDDGSIIYNPNESDFDELVDILKRAWE